MPTESAFQSFINRLRSPVTQTTYLKALRIVLVGASDGHKNKEANNATGVKAADEFLELARTNKRAAEQRLIDYALASNSKPRTTTTYFAAVRSFLLDNEVPLNWKRVNSSLETPRAIGRDRAPTVEEIRRALPHANLRQRVILTVMASSGIRVGAWQWPTRKKRDAPYMIFSDLEEKGWGGARLRVYRDEPDEYVTFISPEALEAIHQYKAARKRAGETITPSSPLLRDAWDSSHSPYAHNTKATPISSKSIAGDLHRLWNRAGLGKKDRQFKEAHGLRKFFKVQCGKAGISSQDSEFLLGHFDPYHKPDLDYIEKEFQRAIPFLAVDKRYELEGIISHRESEHEAVVAEQQLSLMEMRKELVAVVRNTKMQGELLSKLLASPKVKAAMKEEGLGSYIPGIPSFYLEGEKDEKKQDSTYSKSQGQSQS
jgi:integrase